MIGHRIAYAYSGNSDPKLAHNANDLVRSATLNKEVQDGKSVQYGYDRVGNPTSIRYPNQRLVEREFDLLNRISRVKQGNDIVSYCQMLWMRRFCSVSWVHNQATCSSLPSTNFIPDKTFKISS